MNLSKPISKCTEKSPKARRGTGAVPKAFLKLLIALSSAFQLVFARSPEGDVANSSRLREIASPVARNDIKYEDRIVGY